MQVIENLKVKEKLYKEKLDNGLTVMIIPKKDIQKNILFGAQIMAQMIALLLYLERKKKLQFQRAWHIF